MWPAIIAALVGAATTSAGNALFAPDQPKMKDPTIPLTAGQEAKQSPDIYGGQPDMMAQYLANSALRRGTI
jgi:hypothetical protein